VTARLRIVLVFCAALLGQSIGSGQDRDQTNALAGQAAPANAPVLGSARAAGQGLSSAEWAARAVSQYNTDLAGDRITYATINGSELKLDLYRRKDTTGPQPTLIYIHGGGWGAGSRNSILYLLTPWFEMGFTVVNIEYRLTRVAKAPAAVEDCLCALRWVGSHAQDYNIDLNRLVVSGESSGGHLALTTGMIPKSALLDSECRGTAMPKVAAIVDFYGITDVVDLLDGPNRKSYAVSWVGDVPDREDIAKRVSPLTYARTSLPPILAIHGDADPVVPYSHSLRLQEALEKAGVPHQLITVPGGKHGNFTGDENVKV
jgi:acetyl esterase/lipase